MTPFEPLLSPTSNLRQLPDVLNEKSRLIFEGLAISADIITMAYMSMEDTASRYENFSMAPIGVHASMFRHAWTIIHEAFLFQNMLKLALPEGGGPKQKKLFELIKPAHQMRRMRDHLSANVSNTAARQGRSEPLYGTLSWLRPKADVGRLPTGTLTIISAGSHLDSLSRSFGNFGKFHKDRLVDGFSIAGFGVRFEISHTLLGMREILTGLDEDVERSMAAARDDHSGDPDAFKPVHLYGHTMIFEVDVSREGDNLYKVDMELIYPSNVKFEGRDGLSKAPLSGRADSVSE